MFPLKVSDVCYGVAPSPLVPIGILLALWFGFIPWVMTHCCGVIYDPVDEHVRDEQWDDEEPVVRSISYTIRTPGGLLSSLLCIMAVLFYTGFCLGHDPQALGIIILGCCLLFLVTTLNGDPKSDKPEQIVKAFLHKFGAGGSFLFMLVTSCVIVTYFSMSMDDFLTRAILSYIFFSFVLAFFLTMVISIAVSEDHWHPTITGAAEWGYGGAWIATFCVVPGLAASSYG